MNSYEKLLDAAENSGANVIDYPFSSPRIKGLYCDGTIAISKNLKTDAERACVLAEELGHHETSTAVIIETDKVPNRKQERVARALAYNRLIGLTGIISCYRSGCLNLYEMAEHLDVTEDFLKEALLYYRAKYGTCTTLDNHVIYFEPTLGVFEFR